MEGGENNRKDVLPLAQSSRQEEAKKKRFRTEARNKEIECNVCLRKMRSDHIKRHMRKHRDLYSLDEGDIREEIKERKRQ